MKDQNDRSSMGWTVDQLLRLKRHEKPNPEFWEDFEKQLIKRQLQSFVSEPRVRVALRGWFPQGFGVVAPLSVAALCVLGFSFFLNTVEVGKQYATEGSTSMDFPPSVPLYPSALPPLWKNETATLSPESGSGVVRLHGSFVVDALSQGDKREGKPYTTLDSPAVMTAPDRGGASQYVVNSFTSEAFFSAPGKSMATSEF